MTPARRRKRDGLFGIFAPQAGVLDVRNEQTCHHQFHPWRHRVFTFIIIYILCHIINKIHYHIFFSNIYMSNCTISFVVFYFVLFVVLYIVVGFSISTMYVIFSYPIVCIQSNHLVLYMF